MREYGTNKQKINMFTKMRIAILVLQVFWKN